MPEKSRGRGGKRKGTGRMMPMVGEVKLENDDTMQKGIFEVEQMELDEKFEELKQPVYKGKKLDDPIASAVVFPC
jgi:hypothetical protein